MDRDELLNKRKELETLIERTLEDSEMNLKKADKVLPAGSTVFLNFHEVKKEIDKDSQKIVVSIASYYLDEEILKEVEYIKQKIKIDQLTVSSLLFQMKTAEHAIIKLLYEIDGGNLHPRAFEVLASLQRSKMEIIKHLAQFMIILENFYKNFRDEYRLAEGNETENEDNETGLKVRGTRQLLQTLQRLKEQVNNQQENFENVKNNKENNA